MSQCPFLRGAVVAWVVFALLTFPVNLTFLGDDWQNLAAPLAYADPFREHFSVWWNRTPVTGVLVWATFSSRIFEQTWVAMYAFFAVHALAVALAGRWLWQQNSGGAEPDAMEL